MSILLVILGSLLFSGIAAIVNWKIEHEKDQAIIIGVVAFAISSLTFGAMAGQLHVADQKTQLIATHLDVEPENMSVSGDTWFTTDGAYTAVFEHTGPLNPKDVELIQVVKIGDTVK